MIRLDRWAIAGVLAALPVRLLLASATELSPDEAYYVAAARTGYIPPDHPPLVVGLAWLGDMLPGLPLETRIRLLPVAVGAATSWLLVLAVARRGGAPEVQRWSTLLAAWTLLPMAGGFVLTPDSPAMLAFAILLVLQTLRPSASARIGWFLAATVALCAKAVLVPVVLVSCVVPWRRDNPWRLPAVLSLLTAAVCLKPTLVFQFHHAFGTAAWSAPAVLAALAAIIPGQIVLWSPAPWVDGIRARAALSPVEQAWVALLAGLVVVSAIVRGAPPEPNWLAPAAITLLISATTRLGSARPAWRAAVVALGPALTMVAASHALRPWIPVPRSADPTARLHGWSGSDPPLDAPGVGIYARGAMSCVHADDCDEIELYFKRIDAHPWKGMARCWKTRDN